MVRCFIDWILDTELSPRPITLLTPHIPTLTNKTSIYSVNIILYTTEYQSSFKKGSWWKKCISLIFYFIFFFVIFFLSLLNKLWWLWVVKVWGILWVIGCILFINETMLAIWTEMNNGVFINLRWSWFLHHQFVIISFCYNFEQKQNLEIFTETGTGGGGVGAAARRNCNPDNFISLPQPPATTPCCYSAPMHKLGQLTKFFIPWYEPGKYLLLKRFGKHFLISFISGTFFAKSEIFHT